MPIHRHHWPVPSGPSLVAVLSRCAPAAANQLLERLKLPRGPSANSWTGIDDRLDGGAASHLFRLRPFERRIAFTPDAFDLEACPLAWRERLRFCRVCIATGFHAWFHQLDALRSCPMHGGSMLDGCPRCGAHLPTWRRPSLRAWRAMFACPECGEDLFDESSLLSLASGVRGRVILEVVQALRTWRRDVDHTVLAGVQFSSAALDDESRIIFGRGLLALMQVSVPTSLSPLVQTPSVPPGLASIFHRLGDCASVPECEMSTTDNVQPGGRSAEVPGRGAWSQVISARSLRTLRSLEGRLSRAIASDEARAVRAGAGSWVAGFRRRALIHRRKLLALVGEPPRLSWSKDLSDSEPQRLLKHLETRAATYGRREPWSEDFTAWCRERLMLHWLVDTTIEVTRITSYPAAARPDPMLLAWPTVDLAIDGPRVQYAACVLRGSQDGDWIGVFQSLVSPRPHPAPA